MICSCRIEYGSGEDAHLPRIMKCPLCKAAGELLEACKSLTVIDFTPSMDDYVKALQHAYDLAKTAIAKAEGR